MNASARPLSETAAHLQRLIDRNPDRGARLMLADTTARLRSSDDPTDKLQATLRPGRIRFAVHADAEPEVEVVLDPAGVDGFCAGEVSLTNAILDGHASGTGPLGKLLRVGPIVRDMLAADPVRADRRDPSGEPQARRSLPDALWAIRCRALRKSFGREPVLDGVDLGLPEGAITVIVGPSGTGKSVLLKHLLGLLFPDAGEVLVRGQSLNQLRVSQLLALRRRTGVLFQDGALFSSLNLFDNVAFPLRRHTNLSDAEVAAIVERRLADVGLGQADALMPAELSGGMRKRAGLARALVFEPEIVLIDEPDSGLDPVRTALICDLILRLHNDYGGTYVVITHDIATARRIADYVAVLWEGHIVAAGPADEVFQSSDPFVRQFLSADVRGPLGMD